MFNEAEYNYLTKEYRKLHSRTTNDPDEWERFAKEEDEVRLQIFETLANGMSFDEVKRRLVSK